MSNLDKKEALARLDAIEASIKDMKDEAIKLREIIEEKAKPWTPKKLTLCWVWNGDKRPERPIISMVKHFDGVHYATYRTTEWYHAQPLTRAEALAMVDEGNAFRYPWHEMPEWMKWAATDDDGRYFGYSEKPEPSLISGKWTTNGEYELIGVNYGKACDDWRETLEARPE